MSNYYHSYYQGQGWKEKPGYSTKQMVMDKARKSVMSDKQKALHGSLMTFLKDHGFPVDAYKWPKSGADFKRKVRLMFIVLKQNDLMDEFFAAYKEVDV